MLRSPRGPGGGEAEETKAGQGRDRDRMEAHAAATVVETKRNTGAAVKGRVDAGTDEETVQSRYSRMKLR